MKLGSGGGQDKKQTVTAIVAIVVILLAVGLLARNFIGGGGPPAAPPSSGPPQAGFTPPPGEEGAAAPAYPPSSPETGAPPASAPPASEPAPAAAPSEQPSTPPPPPAARPQAAAPGGAMKQIKVFGTVNVPYPAGWKISAGGGNSYAIITDGNARFNVYPPDPTADSAKKIAQVAMKKITPGATVIKEGTDKVSGHDAYWYAIKYQGRVARVVGIDAPTRIAVVQTVRAGDFGKYRDRFNKMQSGITFTGR